MQTEVLTIGNELLDGRVVDSNTTRLAQALSQVGIHIQQRTSVLDHVDAIVAAAHAIISRQTQLCIVSGGLGPTADDLTSLAFAELAHTKLERHPEVEQILKHKYAQKNRILTPNQLRQADRPAGSQLIPNKKGTAPGFQMTHQGCTFFVLPGVPQEFDSMVQYALLPWLQEQGYAAPICRRIALCVGLPEAEVDHLLGDLCTRFPNISVQYRVRFPEVHVQMHTTSAEDLHLLEQAYAYSQKCLGQAVFAQEDTSFAAAVLKTLSAQAQTLAVAESCTGGLVTHLLTEESGASHVLKGGMVVYSNEMKIQCLGVDAAVLADKGAVSPEVAAQMAQKIRVLCGTDWGLAITGIAGPGGATPQKPVGTVHMACASTLLLKTESHQFHGNRTQIKTRSAYQALDMLRRCYLD